MATVRDGIYLEDNPPVRSQFRVGRRDPVKSVIVVHTAESGTDRSGDDPKAENVAEFIRRRSDAGSYHLIGDSDSIIQLVDFANEAFGDRTGSNRWAIHISLAMNAADWSSLPISRREDLLDTAGQMAAIAAQWLRSQGMPAPQPTLITRAQSERPDAFGFISHARRDPGRRSDPGDDFNWAAFFTYYRHHLERIPMPTIPDRTDNIKQWQQALAEAGLARAWWDNQGGLGYPLIDANDQAEVDRYADGDFGDTSLADSLNLLELVEDDAAMSDIGERAIELFGKIDDWRKA